MIEKQRTREIKKLFKDETKYPAFEEYTGLDNIKRIRTYLVLKDDFNTLIKLEELGMVTDDLIKELKSRGYTKINILKK